MRNLVGLEMMMFGKSKQFELEYGGSGAYQDPKGEPIEDLMDMACYVCTANYYSRENDFIEFCPNCGHFDRKRYTNRPELTEALRGQHFGWLKHNGQKAIMVQTWQGEWKLIFAPTVESVDASGKYEKVVSY